MLRKWVEENKKEIALLYLPSYSPELNPDEYLNNDFKSSIGLKSTPKNDKQMKNNVKSHMMFLQKKPKKVAKFFIIMLLNMLLLKNTVFDRHINISHYKKTIK